MILMPKLNQSMISNELENKIFPIRNTQVMLDKDLAELYGVELKRLNEQVKRNIERFPSHFRFQLTQNEYENLRSQFATSSLNHGGRRYLPYVFTEQGVSMLSAVLKSKTAIEISIKIIDSFVNMRRFISQNSLLFERINLLEEKQSNSEKKIDYILDAIESKSIQTKQGIFFDGQVFDAYIFISDILKEAKKSVILIDNYIDENTLLHLSSKVKNSIKIDILTKNITDSLRLDLKKKQ